MKFGLTIALVATVASMKVSGPATAPAPAAGLTQAPSVTITPPAPAFTDNTIPTGSPIP